jgi:photoactive yellow protein
MPDGTTRSTQFNDISLATLNSLSPAQLDILPFGVVGLSPGGNVEIYNATESKLAGLSAAALIGTDFFLNTAQCMNNFMVAQRLEDEPELDATLDYVLTFRMRPTPVRLRLLKSKSASRRYLLIQR